MPSAAVGIDIAKLKFDVAISLSDKKYKTKSFANNERGFESFITWLSTKSLKIEQLHFCMEATGVYSEALAEFLHGIGCLVSVANPYSVKSFAQMQLSRTKTDEADAKLIHDYCAKFKPKAWQPPSKEKKQLSKLVKLREMINKIQKQLSNFAEGSRSETIDELINKLEAPLQSTQQELELSVASLLRVDSELLEQYEILCSIPGVGDKTASMFIALLPNIESFESAKQLEAFAGLNPFQRTSGTSVKGRSHIAKRGNSMLRKALFLPAMTAMRYNEGMVVFNDRMLKANKPGKVRVIACMRKLIRWIYGVLKSKTPFNLALTMPKC